MDNTLFVFVISFNEKELLTTIKSAYDNAYNPENIFFGVYEQRTDGDFVDLSKYKNVKKVEVFYEFPRGTGVARLNSFMLNNNETYCMAVDSHTLFDPDWDTILIKKIKDLKLNYDKPIISYNIDHWTRDKNSNIVMHKTFNPAILKPTTRIENNKHYFEIYSEGFLPDIDHKEYYLSSGQFIFGEMAAFKECMPDPRIFFYGEEQLLALRLCTRGWRIFSLNINVLHHKGVTEEDWEEQNYWRAISRTMECHKAFSKSDLEHFMVPLKGITYGILSGKELGYWGAPDINSYEEYIEKLGFDYRKLNEEQ